MSPADTSHIEKARQYLKEKIGHKEVDIELLSVVINHLADEDQSADAAKVACSNKAELEHIRDQFLISHIGLTLEACLLYTSPSPRDQRGSRMPSSA